MKLVKYTRPVDRTLDPFGWNLPSIVDRFLQEFTGDDAWSSVRIPRTNIRETDSAWEFVMEMPGVSKKDVEVAVEGDRLVVRAESKSHREQEDRDLVRREFQAYRYERDFGIGTDVDRDKIRAHMENGILTVTLPKVPEKVGRKVEVE